MSECRKATRLETMIQEWCQDSTPILPPGEEMELNLLTGSIGFMDAIERASDWARAGSALGQTFGGMSGEASAGSRAVAEVHSRIIREILGEDP
jgi:phage gp29-like protein